MTLPSDEIVVYVPGKFSPDVQAATAVGIAVGVVVGMGVGACVPVGAGVGVCEPVPVGEGVGVWTPVPVGPGVGVLPDGAGVGTLVGPDVGGTVPG